MKKKPENPPPPSTKTLESKVALMRELILSNLVMMGEIPSPTFEEERRVRFLSDRFTECQLDKVQTDEAGNVCAMLPGSEGKTNLLVCAHLDTVFTTGVDHHLNVSSSRVYGPGAADNGLGAAVMASLPTLFENLGVQLRSNLILLGSVRSLGRGNLEGIRFFLDNYRGKLDAAVCVEGSQMGRLSFSSHGMVRGEITCGVPLDGEESTIGQPSGGGGAISVLNDVLTEIFRIESPRKPKTSILIGSVSAGNAYNTLPTQAHLRFEIRSEEAEQVQRILTRFEEIVDTIHHTSGIEVRMKLVAERPPASIGFHHPLVKTTRSIMKSLEIEPVLSPSTGELSALLHKGIPGVTLGITHAEHRNEFNESLLISKIPTGVAQILGTLIAIDSQLPYEPEN